MLRLQTVLRDMDTFLNFQLALGLEDGMVKESPDWPMRQGGIKAPNPETFIARNGKRAGRTTATKLTMIKGLVKNFASKKFEYH